MENNDADLPSGDNEHFLSTFDLGLSAALVCVGFSLVSVERGNLQKSSFVFRRAEGIEKVVEAYWTDILEVKARKYFDTLKMLKNRLYS